MQKSHEPFAPEPQAPEPEPPLDSPLGPLLWILVPLALVLVAGMCAP